MIPDLLDHLRAAFSPNAGTSYDRRFDEVRTASLLILDDLGSQSATPWAKETLDQNLVDERIITRMLDERVCDYIEIKAPAYQGKGRKRTGKR